MNTQTTKAILDGRKVQTRRVFKNKDIKISNVLGGNVFCYDDYGNDETFSVDEFIKTYAKYQKNETIWVREPAKITSWHSCAINDKMTYKYLADDFEKTINIPLRLVKNLDYPKWITNCQGIPNGCIKEMARIFLKVTNVRVARLKDITLDDIKKEGCPSITMIGNNKDTIGFKERKSNEWWINLWNSTAPKDYKWEDNPYILVYEFERIEK